MCGVVTIPLADMELYSQYLEEDRRYICTFHAVMYLAWTYKLVRDKPPVGVVDGRTLSIGISGTCIKILVERREAQTQTITVTDMHTLCPYIPTRVHTSDILLEHQVVVWYQVVEYDKSRVEHISPSLQISPARYITYLGTLASDMPTSLPMSVYIPSAVLYMLD